MLELFISNTYFKVLFYITILRLLLHYMLRKEKQLCSVNGSI